MSKASVLDIDKLLVVAQRRCNDLGVSVKFDPSVRTAQTDGKNIILPYVGEPVTKDQLDTLYGMVIHECGHHLRPAAFRALEKARPPQHVCALFNIIEDDGMERERALEWGGDARALGRMNSIILKEIQSSWEDHLKDGMPNGQDPNPMAAMLLGQLSRLQWDEDSGPYTANMIKAMPKKVQELLTTLEGEGWVQSLRNTKTVADTWNTTIDLVKRLYPNNDQDEYEDIRQAGIEGIENPSASPREDSKSNFKDKQEANGTKKGKGKKGESKVKEADGSTISWKDCVLSEHNEWAGGEGGSLGITWEDRLPKGGACVMPHNKVNLVNLDTSVNSKDHTGFMGNNQMSRAFANKVRRYIQAQARSTVDREKYSGKLDKQAVVRLLMPPIDGGEWNKKIFYDQRKHTVKDTAIFVLVDWSGSMTGSKMRHAADAAQRLVHTFDRVLNIPVALAAFSDMDSQCDIGYIKPWNTRGLPAETIAQRFAKMCDYTSGNDDADAVNWAWHQLLPRKETRKILIVLSDGAPCSSWKGSPDDALKKVTKAIEKDGRVELYGVGIKSNAVKRYYTNHIELKDEKEINETLFTLIKEGNNVKR